MIRDNIKDIIGKEIEIQKEDIIPYVYFVCSMAKTPMYGMNGKSDYIGGIFDRWINIIPESIIFDKCILPIVAKRLNQKHDIKVFSDFYKYDPKTVGIAPDVIGLKTDDKIIPFVKYDDTNEEKKYWVQQPNCPLIELKSFKSTGKMVSLRDQNYTGKYLILVDMELNTDYLLPFFDKTLFTEESIKKLEMPNEFLENDSKGLIAPTRPISFENEKLGKVRLLAITTSEDFMNNTTKCFAGQSPRQFYGLTRLSINRRGNPTPFKEICTLQKNKLYRIDESIFNTPKNKTLDISITNIDSLYYIANTKNKITVKTTDNNVEINGELLEKDVLYTIDFSVSVDRSNNKTIDETDDKGSEYFMNKCVVSYLPNKAEELINNIVDVLK